MQILCSLNAVQHLPNVLSPDLIRLSNGSVAGFAYARLRTMDKRGAEMRAVGCG